MIYKARQAAFAVVVSMMKLAQVEHCAGDAQVTRAFAALGYQGKRFDVPGMNSTVMPYICQRAFHI